MKDKAAREEAECALIISGIVAKWWAAKEEADARAAGAALARAIAVASAGTANDDPLRNIPDLTPEDRFAARLLTVHSRLVIDGAPVPPPILDAQGRELVTEILLSEVARRGWTNHVLVQVGGRSLLFLKDSDGTAEAA